MTKWIISVVVLLVCAVIIYAARDKDIVDRPVSCPATIMLYSRNDNGECSLLSYDMETAEYTTVRNPGNLPASSDIWDLHYAQNKWWAVSVSNPQGVDEDFGLAILDGNWSISAVGGCNILGIYNGKLWFTDWFGYIYNLSANKKSLTEYKSEDLKHMFRLSKVSSNGLIAGSTGTYAGETRDLVIYSFTDTVHVRKYPAIGCQRAAVSTSGKLLAVYDLNNCMRIYTVKPDLKLRLIKKGKPAGYEAFDIRWTPDEKYVVFSAQKGRAVGYFKLGILNISTMQTTWLSEKLLFPTSWGVGEK